jgi:hypothetical protein
MRTGRLSLGIMALAAFPALAQLTTDSVPRGRILPAREELRQQLEASRYHWGPFRIQPLLSLRDIGLQKNLFGTAGDSGSDFRATLGGGVRIIVPAGRKIFFRAQALPEYNWFRTEKERRGFGGDYRLETLALFNRMSVGLSGIQIQGVRPVSTEQERPVLTKRNEFLGTVDVEVLRRVSVFATYATDSPRFDLTDAEIRDGISLDRLERDDSAVRAGVRYRIRPYFSVGAAVEETRTRFAIEENRNNKTNAVMLTVQYDLPRTFVNAAISRRHAEAENGGGAFREISTTTGSYSISRRLTAPINAILFGRRALTYSLFEANTYFVETTNGLSLSMLLRRGLALQVYGDIGTNRYPAEVSVGSGRVVRTDQRRSAGAGLAFPLMKSAILTILGSRTHYDSNIPGFDRTVSQLTSSISLSFSRDLLQ